MMKIMKREEKNWISRQKIMDSAIKEFAEKGYGLSSVNTICSEGGISKGILYHYFKDKDEIYLTCVKECFDQLTGYMKEQMKKGPHGMPDRMSRYFEVRFQFFEENPMFQSIFCGAVITPPAHLKSAVGEIRKEFDGFNIQVLDEILSEARLRSDVTREEVIDTFRQYQDFINAKYQTAGESRIDAKEREKSCSRALSILLYGVISREEE